MKYRFVKRRQEISTEEINSMKDFDSVLKGSRRILDVAYKGKLLWTLTIPVAIVVYILAVNQPNAVEPIQPQLETEQPPKEKAVEQLPEEKKEEPLASVPIEKKAVKPVAKPVEKSKPVQQEPEEFEQPAAEIESSKELIKEDVYIKAAPKIGFEEFYSFIDNELTYPELARQDSIQGHVKVLFAIDREGQVGNVTILESLGDLFDNEAIRVIKRSPIWNPATFNSEPINSRMSIKLTFKIK